MSTGTVVRTVMPWVLLFVLALLMSFQDIRTFDYWWHLRTGALIAETGEVRAATPVADLGIRGTSPLVKILDCTKPLYEAACEQMEKS